MKIKENEVFDEKIFSLLKKIEVPKNPLSFYISISKIEKNLSEGLRDYFYKAINEFLHHSNYAEYEIENGKNSHHFLMKIYYYTEFIDKLAFGINNFLKDIKYYDLSFYIDCAKEFDQTLKLKLSYFIHYGNDYEKIKNYFYQISQNSLENDLKIEEIISKSDEEVFNKFEKKFLKLNPEKDKKIIKIVYDNIKVDLLKYNISYKTTNKSYINFIQEKTQNTLYYKGISICMDKIVSKYNKQQQDCSNFWNRIFVSKEFREKKCFIENIINLKENSFEKWKKIEELKEKNSLFKYEYEFDRFLITYLINHRHLELKQLFYWEATQHRLSEDQWANIGGANLFYLQKIDKNIGNFQLLIFFKQFKDTLIDLYNSTFWPFIKPYFFYILIFKSVKLPLKDRYKLFFLLMFFSAETYQEYFILQKIMKSIERIGLWKSCVGFQKVAFYFKRFGSLFTEFLSSIILFAIFIFILWWFGIMNFFMLSILILVLLINCIKYLIFPGRMEIFRVFTFLSIGLLGYVWFTRVFPKITQPQYISYIGRSIDDLVSLDFSKSKENRKNIINFIYGENYEKLENIVIRSIKDKSIEFANNDTVQKIVENTKKYTTDILQKDKIIKLRKGEYLKYYINKEVDKVDLIIKDKKELSKIVTEEYINQYCFANQDNLCRSKLEKLPVGFPINLTKIEKIINEKLSK